METIIFFIFTLISSIINAESIYLGFGTHIQGVPTAKICFISPRPKGWDSELETYGEKTVKRLMNYNDTNFIVCLAGVKSESENIYNGATLNVNESLITHYYRWAKLK